MSTIVWDRLAFEAKSVQMKTRLADCSVVPFSEADERLSSGWGESIAFDTFDAPEHFDISGGGGVELRSD